MYIVWPCSCSWWSAFNDYFHYHHSHHHCSRWPIWFPTVWFTQYPMCECLGRSSRIFWRAKVWKYPRFATDVYLVDKEQKEEAVEKMRRYFVTRNLNVHTRCLSIYPSRNIFVSNRNMSVQGRKISVSKRNILVPGKNIFISRRNLFVPGRTGTTSSSLQSVRSSTLSTSLPR